MKIYTLHKTQKLPISLDEAWDFLCNPANLSKLTPPEMQMKIISGADRPMYAGQVLQYSVTPVAGIKTKWVSEITQYKHKSYFVDDQLYGPYSFWHHKHFVHEIKGGVEMEDIIDYKVPLGIIGQLMHPILVKPKLESIFEYRKTQMEKIFGSYQ
ncbi:ligand-binding SRPBCC domain-containing protein [Winogradskyella wandonensis]|uniref:Ligand-binding SRPBCC domain-containing protein n=1 Tax=Winogradskyella wandonensis TaxID=1442586 RepID=A0A4R1KJC0_9FLAO|nr:SRPBCC family protein [Winogradskyella wandonensis]TCK64886.1 ligand-binding SRPBCC domain-containing protein [Winogradskyella wandonensis]